MGQSDAHRLGHVLGQHDHGGRVLGRHVRRPLDLQERVTDPAAATPPSPHTAQMVLPTAHPSSVDFRGRFNGQIHYVPPPSQEVGNAV